MQKDFLYGLKRGFPIALGYIPVAFTFGLMAVSGGLPAWMAVFISMSNLTSAGQFAGTNLILGGAGYWEITLTTLVINLRYTLMSLSLSQRIDQKMALSKRMLVAFGITDETFSVASLEPNTITYPYLLGLIAGPFVGWAAGTAFGALICSALPSTLSNAMGIALYGMFLAIILPSAKKSKAVCVILILSITVACILRYIPIFHAISSGFRIIFATIIGAGLGAILFPIESKEATSEEADETIQ